MRLPVESALPEVLAALRRSPAAAVVAPPGSGKTTRIPEALLDLFPRVVVLEPRRLAARWAARFVSARRGEVLGDTVGYQVRFDDRTGPSTRLVYCTEGILPRRLQDDPDLVGVGCVVLDEFHERHLDADLSLALLRRLQSRRPDLRLLVMSATLAAEALAAGLGDCPVIRAEGRAFPVEVEHRRTHDPRPLEEQVAEAVAAEAGRGRGHLLVFLPGAAAIRRCGEACAAAAARHGLRVLPLHGDLPPEDQDEALRPSEARKLILSTNVAESSVTVEGVDAVIDSGLARVLRHLPGSGLPSLQVERISRASADQRAGRAGRTRPGRCLRLYTLADHQARPEHDSPEIAREDLSGLVLELAGMGLRPEDLTWLDPPPDPALARARDLLESLGALRGGLLTATGQKMARLPASPRQARLVTACAERGRLEEGCELAALLEVQPRGLGPHPRARRHGQSDLLARRGERSPVLDRVARHLRARARGLEGAPRQEGDDPLLQALLAAFPDRVARSRGRGREDELLLAGGGSARLSLGSAATGSDWMVALDVEDDPRRGRIVRQASPVDPAWLLDHERFLEERVDLEWNGSAGRVERAERLAYGGLVLHESRAAAPPSPEAGDLVFRAARSMDPARLGADVLRSLQARAAALDRALPGEGWDLPASLDFEALLRELCGEHANLKDLERAAPAWMAGRVQAALGPSRAARLDSLAPTHVALPGRRRAPVEYPPGQDPYVASRMADFFGLRQAPRVAGGRLPLVLHLLAPSGRPVQITSDLEGFWERHWPRVRRELCRRYPRHPWPEDPTRP